MTVKRAGQFNNQISDDLPDRDRPATPDEFAAWLIADRSLTLEGDNFITVFPEIPSQHGKGQ